MLKPKSPQNSFYGSYLYDRIVPNDHPVSSTGQALLRKINAVVDLSFVGGLDSFPAWVALSVFTG